MALITKIISGGQIGADIGALRAAVALGIETGGWMPQGFKTLEGDHPEYAEAYGMQEHMCLGYPPRTRQNVLESDATLRIAYNFDSPGERCTLNAIREFSRPHTDVRVEEGQGRLGTGALYLVQAWLQNYEISVLNVAGNARSELEFITEDFIVRLVQRHNQAEARRIALEQATELMTGTSTTVTDAAIAIADVATSIDTSTMSFREFFEASIRVTELPTDEETEEPPF